MSDTSRINGRIIKSVGGFFHTEADTFDDALVCTAKGIFRHNKITPVAGDDVIVELIGDTPVITDVLPRKNHIIRPPLANLDAAIIVISTVEPVPNRLVLDKLIAVFESKDIEPILLFTKIDKKEEKKLRAIYKKAGFTVFSVSNEDGSGIEKLRAFLRENEGICALIGNTGVGKSSTLNSLFPDLALETAQISKKLGRGKHTTRQVELYKLGERSYIADTPGFSTVEAAKYGKLDSSDVAGLFREFVPYLDKCKFAGCRHVKEEGCGILAAVENGEIDRSRFESYVKIFDDAFAEERNYK